jgi:proteasome accessory factor B
MAARRTERLLNLVICLLHTRSYLSAERIREIVPGYDEAPSDEAFKRMFERDKEDLRDLGIPLETGESLRDDEPGYRVTRDDYALPEVSLEPDEAAALGLASRMWSSASLGGPAARALRKLEAAGVEITPLPEGLRAPVDGGSRTLPAVAEAAREGRPVRFDYRGATDPAPSTRHVEPWGVVWWHGRWYLAGHDLDRGEPRVFRLSRIVGDPEPVGTPGTVTVPAGVDLTALVSSSDNAPTQVTAQVKVRRDRALGLRRRALRVEATDGWDVLTLPCPDPQRLVEQVLPYGPAAVVLSPQEARDLATRRLRALAEAGR